MAVARKLTVALTDEMRRELQESVEAGEYASTGEALRDAVRLWRRERREQSERLEAVRARVKRSLADTRPPMPLDDALSLLAGEGDAAAPG